MSSFSAFCHKPKPAGNCHEKSLQNKTHLYIVKIQRLERGVKTMVFLVIKMVKEINVIFLQITCCIVICIAVLICCM